ncbi:MULTISPECIES: hypothetical protein [Bacillaceae]|uniref:Uncharacterized protein n=2 Tax=Bacillaceae TaxID=186817 RepID=A0ABQ5TKI0_9BACI|nr:MULTISPECIES: hypothetical protein [Bacillaceae]GLO65022.1 hypothetical protein MACH08_08060 [Oceanobacillus kimchii]
MRGSFVVPRLLILVGVFFISAGVGLRNINTYVPILGIVVGILFFLLAGHISRLLGKKEEQIRKEH